jgi:Rieske Fe-S protein
LSPCKCPCWGSTYALYRKNAKTGAYFVIHTPPFV